MVWQNHIYTSFKTLTFQTQETVTRRKVLSKLPRLKERVCILNEQLETLFFSVDCKTITNGT